MTVLQKTLITAAVAIAATAGLYEAHRAARARSEARRLTQEQASLMEQIQQLERERNDATNRAAAALSEVERMRRDYGDVLRLRGDLARASAELRQLSAARTNAAGELSSETDRWAKQGDSFKQWFRDNPDKGIPELELLWNDDWILEGRLNPAVATNRTSGNTIEMIASALRQRAKDRLAGLLGHALSLYAAEHAGELPGALHQLLPYLPQQPDTPVTENFFASAQPVNDSMLARYDLQFTGSIARVPRDQPIVIEKAAVDPRVDTLLKIKVDGYCYESIGVRDGMAGELRPWAPEDLKRMEPFTKSAR